MDQSFLTYSTVIRWSQLSIFLSTWFSQYATFPSKYKSWNCHEQVTRPSMVAVRIRQHQYYPRASSWALSWSDCPASSSPHRHTRRVNSRLQSKASRSPVYCNIDVRVDIRTTEVIPQLKFTTKAVLFLDSTSPIAPAAAMTPTIETRPPHNAATTTWP